MSTTLQRLDKCRLQSAYRVVKREHLARIEARLMCTLEELEQAQREISQLRAQIASLEFAK